MQDRICEKTPNAPFVAVLDGTKRNYTICLRKNDGKKQIDFTTWLRLPNMNQLQIDYINKMLEKKFESKNLSVLQDGEGLLCKYTRVFPPELAWKNKSDIYTKIITQSVSVLNETIKEIEKILLKENFPHG